MCESRGVLCSEDAPLELAIFRTVFDSFEMMTTVSHFRRIILAVFITACQFCSYVGAEIPANNEHRGKKIAFLQLDAMRKMRYLLLAGVCLSVTLM